LEAEEVGENLASLEGCPIRLQVGLDLNPGDESRLWIEAVKEQLVVMTVCCGGESYEGGEDCSCAKAYAWAD
jgi:hypothetical protein